MRKPKIVKAKPELAIQPLAETMGLAKLTEIFSDLISAVEQMIDSGEKPQTEDIAALAEKAQAALTGPERIDQIVALLNAHEFQEALLRKAVQQAEKRAREHAAFCKSIKGSIELYMLECSIQRIEGFAHRLAIYKQAPQLEVYNEELVPEEFWDSIPVVEHRLNKDRLIAALSEGREIPGAELHTDRKRLDVK